MSERIYVAKAGSATASTPVALTAGTAKSVVGVLGASTDTPVVVEIGISFDSVTSSAVPALVELGRITALGTMTAFTPVQTKGISLASSCSAGYNATAEPTYNAVLRSWYVPVFNGLWSIQFPLGREPSVLAVSQGFALRVNAPAAVNCHPYIEYSE